MATYRFDEFQLQADERRLLRNGVSVSLPPRAFDVLVFLVEHAGSLVAKDEILGSVWRDTAVEEANLSVAISAIRRVIGHDAVVTVPKYGYRFAAELHRESCADASPAAALAVFPASAAAPVIHGSGRFLLGLIVIVISAAAFAIGRAARKPGDTTAAFAEITGPQPERLTMSVEPEMNPAWAANGRILFASTRHGNSELYASSSDGTGVRRLTDHLAHDQDPVLSHDGRTVAFASDRGGNGLQIYLMDADGSHIRPLTALSQSCVQPSWSPDDTRIAFQRNDEPDVGQDVYTVRNDGSNLTRVTSHRMSDVSPDWAPGGRLIAFASNRDGDLDLYVADLDGRHVVRLTSQMGADDHPAWSPDGSQIAFSSNRHGAAPDVFVMNADGSGSRRVTIGSGTEPTWSADGSEMAFISTREGNPEIFRLALEGSTNVTTHIARDEFGAWSPDGRAIAFTSNRDGKLALYLKQGTSGAATRITDGLANDWFPSWSPDGRRIVFQSDRAGTGFLDLYIIDVATRMTRRLTSGHGIKASPAWSPDGRRIAFQGNPGEGPYDVHIYTMAPDGSDIRRLTAETGYEGDPAWSPDGLRIAFTANRDGQFDIFVFEIARRITHRLTAHPARDVNPWWSSDGRHIVFASERAERHLPHDLYVMAADGRDPVRLTTRSGQWPRWSRDGRLILFTSERQGNHDLYLLMAPR